MGNSKVHKTIQRSNTSDFDIEIYCFISRKAYKGPDELMLINWYRKHPPEWILFMWQNINRNLHNVYRKMLANPHLFANYVHLLYENSINTVKKGYMRIEMG